MNKKVLGVVVLDESGSMESIKDKTISCMNEYVESLKPQGKMCHLTLVTFRTGDTTWLCDDVPVKDVPKITHANYRPGGGTPLLDAVGATIERIKQQVEKMPDNPDVLFIVVTDGEENCSRQYTHPQVIDLIAAQEKAGWTFVYLGANQDSWRAAHGLGYGSVGNVANFTATAAGVEAAMSRTMSSTADYFSGRTHFYATAAARGQDTAPLNYQVTSFYAGTSAEQPPAGVLGNTNPLTGKKGGSKHGRH